MTDQSNYKIISFNGIGNENVDDTLLFKEIKNVINELSDIEISEIEISEISIVTIKNDSIKSKNGEGIINTSTYLKVLYNEENKVLLLPFYELVKNKKLEEICQGDISFHHVYEDELKKSTDEKKYNNYTKGITLIDGKKIDETKKHCLRYKECSSKEFEKCGIFTIDDYNKLNQYQDPKVIYPVPVDVETLQSREETEEPFNIKLKPLSKGETQGTSNTILDKKVSLNTRINRGYDEVRTADTEGLVTADTKGLVTVPVVDKIKCIPGQGCPISGGKKNKKKSKKNKKRKRKTKKVRFSK